MMNKEIERIVPVGPPGQLRFITDARKGACFDHTNLYRYSLWRRFDAFGNAALCDMCAFIGLNPSTATESVDDSTVKRCIAFAKRWKFNGMIMLNLFAWRATDPIDMKCQANPVGLLNDEAIDQVVSRAGKTVCCWGIHGEFMNRGPELEQRLFRLPGFNIGKRKLYHLGLTLHGFPRHPLYVASNTELQELQAAQFAKPRYGVAS
jgi:hypothetical protein